MESVTPDKFVTLISLADVMIDPYPWGGGVTTLEALSVGTLVVTLPSKQSVVALAAGFYGHLGLDGSISVGGGTAGVNDGASGTAGPPPTDARLVVRDVDEFVEMALLIARDSAVRAALGARVESAMAQRPVFEDESAVDEWERVLLSVAVL